MQQCETARWYLIGMGSEPDLHTPHWHGNTVFCETAREAIEAVWRIEAPRLIGGSCASCATSSSRRISRRRRVAALERWPEAGIPLGPARG